jgi:3-hydroxyisobutyrate dehydrogenase-like beta-hydroxyacid dehydrogenase
MAATSQRQSLTSPQGSVLRWIPEMGEAENMSDVSIIGTGAMGSALAEGLAAAGAEVAVWNRTKQRAEALSGPQVRVVSSVGEAIASSPITIVAVSDHELARSLIEMEGDLDEKVVVSTSFATSDQAEAFAGVVTGRGGHYLDLAIAAYPSEVRSRSGVLFISGDAAVYEAHRRPFEQIGRTSYVDDMPGSAFISEMAVLLGYLPMAVGILQGLHVCQQHGLSADWFKDVVGELYPLHIRTLLERVTADGGHAQAEVEASVDVWGAGAAEYAEALRELGLDAGMYEALQRLFAAASEAGRGHADWTCIAAHVATR